jgi:predicted Holliday junction resolvase-like endonuclease
LQLISLHLPLLVTAAILILAAGIFVGAQLAALRAERKFVEILRSRELEWETTAEANRRSSLVQSRRVIGGNFSEQLAPFLPNFPFDPTEARFVGKPVDFIVFRGHAEGATKEIVFVEVKSGASKLSTSEIAIRDAVLDKKVSFYEYRVPEEITR